MLTPSMKVLMASCNMLGKIRSCLCSYRCGVCPGFSPANELYIFNDLNFFEVLIKIYIFSIKLMRENWN